MASQKTTFKATNEGRGYHKDYENQLISAKEIPSADAGMLIGPGFNFTK
jgi:hypothetical protein